MIRIKNSNKFSVLKVLIALSIPTILEQILSTMLQYVDTAMVGRLGEQATAAVSVTTTINWLIGSISSAVGVAVLALISRAYGGNDKKRITNLSKQVFLAVVVIGAILTVISVALSPFIPTWMQADEDIRHNASMYFMIISIPLVFRTASSLFGSAIRAIQNTRTPMLINMTANVLNVVLNLMFIYVFGLGVVGAAIGSAISYTVAGLMMYYAYIKNELLTWKMNTLYIDKPLIVEGLKLCIPVLGTSVVSCFGYIVFAGLVSSMGTTIFAAHSIAVTAETIFYIPGYGLRTATSAMVGASLGEGDKGKFEKVSLISIILTLLMMCVSGIVLFIVAVPLMRIFTPSDNVANLGGEMLKMVAFSEPFFGLMIVLEGIYYGLGKTKYAFFIESACMWGIRIVFSILCVKVWHLGLRYVWYCMIADNVAKAILFLIPVLYKRKQIEDDLFD